MNTQKYFTPLKQARKKSDIPLSTMADILITDVSNLSKYERGIVRAPLFVLLGYHVLTDIPLHEFFTDRVKDTRQFLQHQLESKKDEFQDIIKTRKIERILEFIETRLSKLSCLQDVKDKKHD